jgi:predicted nucleotidyltransferase
MPGEKRRHTDLNFHVDRGNMRNLLELGGLYSDLEAGFDKKLDVLTTQMLSPAFLNAIRREEVLIYARQ